jgi:hypothetical protein
MRSKAVAWVKIFDLDTFGSQARCSGSDQLGPPLKGRYWRHSGHWLALALNGSVANDPERTLGLFGFS